MPTVTGEPMLGKLNAEQIEQVLHSQTIGRIGCHCEGLTYVVPVTFVYDGERIIAHSSEGMKLQMMRANPSVCFQVDDIENMTSWKSVILWGAFRELEGTEAAQAIGLLADRIRSEFVSQTVHRPNGGSKIR